MNVLAVAILFALVFLAVRALVSRSPIWVPVIAVALYILRWFILPAR